MKLLDLFSGVGGFHKGFAEAGFEFDWVGFSEIDKYANGVYKYNYKESVELGDIRLIQPERDLPNIINVLTSGFPCQSFSQAGRRKGFKDTRGTLFFEIARILRYYVRAGKPIDCFLLENVKGLLSHDNGRTFAIIYRVLTNIGYTVECQLLNTSIVLPQHRERIYIVGHFGKGCKSKVFPIGKNDKKLAEDGQKQRNRLVNAIDSNYWKGADGKRTMINTKLKKLGNVDTKGHNSLWGRVYDPNGLSSTLNSEGGGLGAKTGLYQVSDEPKIAILEPNRKGYAEAHEGDTINLKYPTSKTRRGRVGKKKAQTIDTIMHQVTVQKTGIRRLTPVECNRLQGFPDTWNEKGIVSGKIIKMSDTQRYRQAGNAVTVPIVKMIAEKIKKEIFNES